ncbi:uncharacterized protein KGF55_002185 [Candida pseudojiufengensis]|uniref:uncharacterized protein n=1 Tax=Candida pseudojiufengensis TaxID=497109 RepID=UPI00222553C0|nr:uncharacterized protein KGF55_002185 [Candida pseudojiufengensis]KAI5964243.1 hypothetical protein KGF55_002185 [Candida pseudojiufengensis]
MDERNQREIGKEGERENTSNDSSFGVDRQNYVQKFNELLLNKRNLHVQTKIELACLMLSTVISRISIKQGEKTSVPPPSFSNDVESGPSRSNEILTLEQLTTEENQLLRQQYYSELKMSGSLALKVYESGRQNYDNWPESVQKEFEVKLDNMIDAIVNFATNYGNK